METAPRRKPSDILSDVGKASLVGLLFDLAYHQLTYFGIQAPATDDFAGFYVTGWMVAHHLVPYSGPLPMLSGVTDRGFAITWPADSPPFALLLFQVFTVLPFVLAERVWQIISLVTYVAIVIGLGLSRRSLDGFLFLAWALASQAIAQTVQERQIYVLTMLLVVGGISASTRRRPLLTSLCIGLLVAIKPNVAIWVLAMFVAGDRSLALASGGWTLIASGVAAVVYGPPMFLDWLIASSRYTSDVPFNGSVFALARLLGHPDRAREVGVPIAAAIGLGFLLWVRYARPSRDRLAFTALSVAFLAAPVAWYGNLVVLIPLMARATWRWPLVVLGVLMVVPIGTLAQLVAALIIATVPSRDLWMDKRHPAAGQTDHTSLAVGAEQFAAVQAYALPLARRLQTEAARCVTHEAAFSRDETVTDAGETR